MILRRALVLATGGILSLGYRGVGAQEPGVVRGTVRDSATGAPVVGVKATVRCEGCYGRHPTDSLGNFRIMRVRPGLHPLEFHCPSRTMLGRELGNVEVMVEQGAEAVVNFSVPPGACYEPPYSERKGVFRGQWTTGFEASEFIPCPDSALGVTRPMLPGKRYWTSAWATLSPAAREQRIDWPDDAPRDAWGSPRYFVIWRGTLKGPGMYGHLGVGAFEMVVDEIVLATTPGSDECAKAPPR